MSQSSSWRTSCMTRRASRCQKPPAGPRCAPAIGRLAPSPPPCPVGFAVVPPPLSSLTHPPAPPSLPLPKAAPARASSPAPSHANRSLRPRPHNTAIAKIPPIAGYGRGRAIGTLTHKSSQRPQRTPVRRALRSPLSSHRCSLLDDTSRPAGVLMSRMRSLATLSARSTSSASPSHAPASVSRRLIRPHRETTRMHTASRSTARSRSRYLTPK